MHVVDFCFAALLQTRVRSQFSSDVPSGEIRGEYCKIIYLPTRDTPVAKSCASNFYNAFKSIIFSLPALSVEVTSIWLEYMMIRKLSKFRQISKKSRSYYR